MTNTKFSVARDHNQHFVTLQGDHTPIGYVKYAYGRGWEARNINDEQVGTWVKGKDAAIQQLIKGHGKAGTTFKASEPSATAERKTEREATPEAKQQPDITPEEVYGGALPNVKKSQPQPKVAPKAQQMDGAVETARTNATVALFQLSGALGIKASSLLNNGDAEGAKAALNELNAVVALYDQLKTIIG